MFLNTWASPLYPMWVRFLLSLCLFKRLFRKLGLHTWSKTSAKGLEPGAPSDLPLVKGSYRQDVRALQVRILLYAMAVLFYSCEPLDVSKDLEYERETNRIS